MTSFKKSLKENAFCLIYCTLIPLIAGIIIQFYFFQLILAGACLVIPMYFEYPFLIVHSISFGLLFYDKKKVLFFYPFIVVLFHMGLARMVFWALRAVYYPGYGGYSPYESTILEEVLGFLQFTLMNVWVPLFPLLFVYICKKPISDLKEVPEVVGAKS